MKIRPGRYLLWGAAGLVATSWLAFFWPGVAWLLGGAALAAIGLALADFRDLRARRKSVTVERTMPPVVGRDVSFRVEWRINNAGSRSCEGELRDRTAVAVIPPFEVHPLRIEAGQSQRVAASYRIPIRGAYEFGPVWLRFRGRFGLLEAQWSLPCPARIKVLPEGFVSPDSLQQDERAELLQLDKISRTKHQGAGTEFEMLSEYRPGDDPRRIDWRTTARYRRPVVRRFQIERHRDVMIVIDCGRLMGSDAGRGTKLDCAVDSALLLARAALKAGDRCGIALFDDQVLGYLPPVSGLPSLRRLAESIYDVQSRWRESDFSRMFATLQSRQTKRSLIVVLSDIVDAETSTRFRASVARLSRRHVVLFAALRTPLLREIVHAPVRSMLDGSRKAVTFRMLRQREQALHSMKRGSAHVLDVEPSRLTIPLINRFVELRQENLL